MGGVGSNHRQMDHPIGPPHEDCFVAVAGAVAVAVGVQILSTNNETRKGV